MTEFFHIKIYQCNWITSCSSIKLMVNSLWKDNWAKLIVWEGEREAQCWLSDRVRESNCKYKWCKRLKLFCTKANFSKSYFDKNLNLTCLKRKSYFCRVNSHTLQEATLSQAMRYCHGWQAGQANMTKNSLQTSEYECDSVQPSF